LLLGGFHLGGASRTGIQAIVARLRSLGVRKVAPSHCTGEAATALFRQAWGHDFVEAGLGAVIVPAPSRIQ
jgi:7,8-dihydropterin-6-yl-methyl-4-(beta-D-ribofuranosyl)aminobenzene 5'-phosphate synthase